MPNIHFGDFDAIVLTGDFCEADFLRAAQFKEIEKKRKNPAYKMKPWYRVFGRRKARNLIENSAKQGRKILEFLDSQGVSVYVVPGNNDWAAEKSSDWEYERQGRLKGILSGLKNIKNTHNRLLEIGDFQIIGYGLTHSPEYPQYPQDLNIIGEKFLAKKKRDYTGWQKRMDYLFQKASKPVIFLSHNAPFGTKIDKILMRSSPRLGHHFGSLIVREAIEKYQPLLSISGHMHEHYGKVCLGDTLCIAAGFGADSNTLIETKGAGIIKLRFFRQNPK